MSTKRIRARRLWVKAQTIPLAKGIPYELHLTSERVTSPVAVIDVSDEEKLVEQAVNKLVDQFGWDEEMRDLLLPAYTSYTRIILESLGIVRKRKRNPPTTDGEPKGD